MRTAAEKAKLQQGIGAKISNHSVRKTSISRLLDADIPENFVAQLSGHKSIESLQSYKVGQPSSPTENVIDAQQKSGTKFPCDEQLVESAVEFEAKLF